MKDPGPKHHRATIPMITDGDPQLPFEGVEVPEPTREQLAYAPIVEQWRRYDRGIWGEIITHDGLSNGKTEQVPGLFVTIKIKHVETQYMVMDDGKLYRLGNRAYAGT